MGIQIPEEFGGAAGTLFEAVLAVEEISAVDPAVGVLVDVQNTLVINALLLWGTDAQKKQYLAGAREQGHGIVCTVGGCVGLGRLCAAVPRDARRSER